LTKDRTTVTDEFRELEHDIDLRREGIQRLTIASRDYHYSLVRKKESLAAGETEKLLPLDAQGITMIRHGEEFGDESAYGACCRCAYLRGKADGRCQGLRSSSSAGRSVRLRPYRRRWA
jgi:hypothetical protein